MLAETARLFTSSPRESPIGSPPVPPTPVDSSLCGSRGVRLSSEAPAANAGAAAFPATVKCARQAPSVNRFHHPRPFTTLVGSPLSRNPFQISGLPPTASHLTESLPIDAGEMTFILDSCYSAKSVEANDFKPGPMGSRGLGQLAYDKRMRILAASQSDAEALEESRLQQGLLSYVLTEQGLKEGKADWKPIDKQITLGEWLTYAADQVPKLNEPEKQQ